MTAGRPLKYSTPEEMQQKIDEYKRARDNEGLPYTRLSLVLFLGFVDKNALDSTYKNKEEFSHTIKKIYLEIENSKIDAMYGGNPNTTWNIFDFKCNYGWNDKKAEDENNINVVGFDFNVVKPKESSE